MSLLGSLAGAAIGFVTGGPGGAITGFQTGGRLTTPSPAAPRPPALVGGGSPFPTIPAIFDPIGMMPKLAQGLGMTTAAAGGACAKGYHLNRKPLAASKRHGAVPAGAMCVRNRHINPLNAKAITRSLRRVKRARKLVAKLQSFGGARRITSGGHRPGCGCFRCRKR